MKIRVTIPFLLIFSLLLSATTYAQDAPSGSPQMQGSDNGQSQGPGGGPGGGQSQGQGQGQGGGMSMGMGSGRGITGTVTAVAADSYTIKTDAGDSYTARLSSSTRIVKQMAMRSNSGQGQSQGPAQGQGQSEGQSQGQPSGPQTLKPTDIKVGDTVMAMGEIDATAKSVTATTVMQIDPERAKQMREMQANFGKTWLQGKVTAIDEVKVTLLGTVDNAAHTFVADENTTFRKRRDPITLADIQTGDTVRVEGAIKNGEFVATSVNVMSMPTTGGSSTGGPGGGTPTVPREGQPNTPPTQ
jgi:hypothetical protein